MLHSVLNRQHEIVHNSTITLEGVREELNHSDFLVVKRQWIVSGNGYTQLVKNSHGETEWLRGQQGPVATLKRIFI